MRGILTIAALGLAGACAPATPDRPTWIDDVRPILLANCGTRCHGLPSISEAPPTFRLDTFDVTPLPEGFDLDGAASMAMQHALSDVTSIDYMPPRFKLSDRQKDIIQAWEDLGDDADDGIPPRGTRADNAQPTLELERSLEVTSKRVRAGYLIEDGDGDLVTGVIFAQPEGDLDRISVQATLYSGRGDIDFRIDPGIYDLTAELDDGVELVTVHLDSVEVQP